MANGNYVGNYMAMNPGYAESYGEVFPGYSFTGRLGNTTNPGTANQVAEVIARLNEGSKVVELSTEPKTLEMTPQEQYREINRIAKLAGAVPTVHAPIVDPAGFVMERGGASWSEDSRKEAERYLLDTIERVREANPEGNINVTVHASNTPALQWEPASKGKEKEAIPIAKTIVNVATGQVTMAPREEAFRPGTAERQIITPEKKIEEINKSIWEGSLISLSDYTRSADIHRSEIREMQNELKRGAFEPLMEIREGIKEALREKKIKEEEAEEIIKKSLEEANKSYNQQLDANKGRFEQKMGHVKTYYISMEHKIEEMYNELQQGMKRSIEIYGKTKEDKERERILDEINDEWRIKKAELEKAKDLEEQLNIRKALIDGTMRKFREIEEKGAVPKVFVPLQDFARDKTAETFSNIAWKVYDEWGDKSPIISVENFFPNMAFSRAEDLKDVIEESRKKFVEKAIKGGMNSSKAKEAAEKVIGATWDVAHINLLRKYGYGKEEIVKETEKIAPFVKKLHLVDNFGYEDSHLPVGMGTVPIREIMEKMEKEGFTGPMISEAFTFAQQFRISPHIYELEALNAPLQYPSLPGPSWQEVRGMGGGYMTFGTFMPEQHFAMYGSGWAGLPMELGGKIPGSKASQFSGTPVD